MSNDTVLSEFNSLPAEMQREVVDFIAFLKSKRMKTEKKKKREFGILKGKIIIHSDFDKPLEDFKENE